MNEQTRQEDDRLLRKKEAAKMLACSLRAVDRLVNAGKLTRVKVAGVKFRLSQVRSLMNGGNHDFQG